MAPDTGDALLYDYLGWAIEAVRQLRSRFVPDDVDRLVLTRRYCHLQSTSHVDLQLVRLLVDAEVSEQGSA